MKSLSLYDFLKKEVKKMAGSLGRYEHGNIYPLLMNEIEKYLIELVLEETNNNYVRSAQVLGISRSRLYRRIEFLGVQKK